VPSLELEAQRAATGSSGAVSDGSGTDDAAQAYRLLQALAAALQSKPLATAVVDASRQPGACYVPLAVRIVRALPMSQHGLASGTAPHVLGMLHAHAAGLLGSLCWPLIPGSCDQAPLSGSQTGTGISGGSDDSCRAAGAASGSDSSSLTGTSPAPCAQAGSDRQRLATWEVVRLVPHLALVLRQLAADSSGCLPDCLARVCEGYGLAVALAGDQHSMRSWDELGAWAAAADAGLRLLPLLADLDARWRQLGPDEKPREATCGGAAELSTQLVAALRQGGAMSASSWARDNAAAAAAAAAADKAPAALLRQLWQLHSAACRMMLSLAAGSSRLAGPDLQADDWAYMLQSLNLQCIAACLLTAEAAEKELGRCATGMHRACAPQPPALLA
jgi:hypothetical protein